MCLCCVALCTMWVDNVIFIIYPSHCWRVVVVKVYSRWAMVCVMVLSAITGMSACGASPIIYWSGVAKPRNVFQWHCCRDLLHVWPSIEGSPLGFGIREIGLNIRKWTKWWHKYLPHCLPFSLLPTRPIIVMFSVLPALATFDTWHYD
jgi:hypothetical protein